jgi:phosphoribosylglycinamide formyltransferase-1
MRVAVFVSGEGTNLQALIDGNIELDLVLSNRPSVHALERAQRAGIATMVVDHTAYATREEFETDVLAVLDDHGIEAIVLAGFMRILTSAFVARFPHRIVNTHPSLLPAFPGAHAVDATLAHGAKVSGVTIHFVDDSLDGGPIIAQAAVAVLPNDSAASLHERIKAEEHRLLPEVVRALAAGRLSCQGRIVRVLAE